MFQVLFRDEGHKITLRVTHRVLVLTTTARFYAATRPSTLHVADEPSNLPRRLRLSIASIPSLYHLVKTWDFVATIC